MLAAILIRGCGDIGSAVAHGLSAAGYRVVMHDVDCPAHPRRGMCYVDALFDGTTTLEGIRAKRAPAAAVGPMLDCRRAIPICTAAVDELLAQLDFDVLVDARMRKRLTPENQRGLAGLAIGLGPNFRAGETVDLAIETSWDKGLGSVIASGATEPLEGEPRPLGGFGRERNVYAPVAGFFETGLRIGDRVARGDPIGAIGAASVAAPLTGYLRGLTRGGVEVEAGTKIVEVDPRDPGAVWIGIGERPRRIARAVQEVVASLRR